MIQKIIVIDQNISRRGNTLKRLYGMARTTAGLPPDDEDLKSRRPLCIVQEVTVPRAVTKILFARPRRQHDELDLLSAGVWEIGTTVTWFFGASRREAVTDPYAEQNRVLSQAASDDAQIIELDLSSLRGIGKA